MTLPINKLSILSLLFLVGLVGSDRASATATPAHATQGCTVHSDGIDGVCDSYENADNFLHENAEDADAFCKAQAGTDMWHSVGSRVTEIYTALSLEWEEHCASEEEIPRGGWDSERGASFPAPEYFLAAKTTQTGDCGCDGTKPTGGQPIEIGTGNMYHHETDFVAAEPRLTYSRWYNSTKSAVTKGLGSNWRGSFDAHLTPLMARAYPWVGISGMNTSSNYSSPQAACEAGFAELKAAHPEIVQINQGVSAHYVPPGIGELRGVCQVLNQWGTPVDVIDILSDDVHYLLPGVYDYQVGVELLGDDGSTYDFYCSAGTCHPLSTESMQLTVDSSGQYTLTEPDGVVEKFDETGLLLSRTWKDGYQISVTHDSKTAIPVTDNHGRKLVLNYDAQEKLTSIDTPDGRSVTYGWDSQGRLTSATNPTGTRVYQYTNASFPVGLTGIVDENTSTGVPYLTWTYDTLGRANNNAFSGGVDSFSMVYNSDGSTQVTDPLGVQRTYTFLSSFGNPHLLAISGPVCNNCGLGASLTYDPNTLRLTSSTDWNGHVTGYAFDAANQLHVRVDAQGTSLQRTTTTDWDDVLGNPLETKVTDNLGALQSKVDWVYNAAGEPLARCEEDPSVSAALSYTCSNTGTVPAGVRRWTYAYCAAGDGGQCPLAGLLKSVTDPLGHATTYLYFASDDSSCASAPTTCPHRKGDLQTVTNALGQYTTFTKYDGAGRPLTLLDANNVQTDLQYNGRGWVTQVAVRATNGTTGSGDVVTGYTYDNTGNITRISHPDASYVNLTYDAAHRLTDVADNLGDTIHYTLDAASHRTKEETKDPSGTLKHSLSRQFNAIGQLYKTINADGTTANGTYTYDAGGNPNLSTNGRGIVTDSDYDALDRLSLVAQDPGTTPAHVAAYSNYYYDPLDRLTKVTDPHGLDTTYVYDGLGNQTQLGSPDTGTTTATYDAAGNALTRTDARGSTTTSTYDALNRVTAISYPNTALNRGYGYDTFESNCPSADSYPVGHMTHFTDDLGTTQLCYDRYGRLAYKYINMSNGGSIFNVQYSYDKAGRLTQLIEPKGTVVNYTRDGIGRITHVGYHLSGGSTDTTLVSNVTYYPFGPVATITYGNGRTLTRTYDQDYVIGSVVDTTSGKTDGLNLTFGRDVIGNLTQVSSATAGNTLQYDALDRLTNVNDLTTSAAVWTYGYDATGNRTSKQAGTATATLYTYGTTNHRLAAVGTVGRSYDAAGNTSAIGSGAQGFGYSDAGRMNQVKNAGTVIKTYQYNALDQRVRKSHASITSEIQKAYYDESGHVITDIDYTNQLIDQYVWMDDLPIAVLSGTTSVLSYIEPDHLGTPRVAIDATSNTADWSWTPVNDPFGETQPTGLLTLNLRFPGQVYDAESGMNYNYFRDYDAGTGRYVESDPTGLRGGISTYAYVNGSPLSRLDPWGLEDLILEPTSDNVYPQDSDYNPSGVYSVGTHGYTNDTNNVEGPKGLPIDVDTLANSILDPKNKNPWDGKKPIRLVICFAAKGGGFSIAARLQRALTRRLGHPVTVQASAGLIALKSQSDAGTGQLIPNSTSATPAEGDDKWITFPLK